MGLDLGSVGGLQITDGGKTRASSGSGLEGNKASVGGQQIAG